jgi:hypothetical protein
MKTKKYLRYYNFYYNSLSINVAISLHFMKMSARDNLHFSGWRGKCLQTAALIYKALVIKTVVPYIYVIWISPCILFSFSFNCRSIKFTKFYLMFTLMSHFPSSLIWVVRRLSPPGPNNIVAITTKSTSQFWADLQFRVGPISWMLVR